MAAIVGGLSGYVATGSFKGAIAGAVTGMAFAKVGMWANNPKNNVTLVQRAFVKGATGGTLSKIQGGSFSSAFKGAFFGQIATPSINLIPGDGIARTIAAGVIGGSAAKIGGGDFESGAVSAMAANAFNNELVGTAQKENPAIAIADEALKDGHLSLGEANEIWRNNNDPNLTVTVDASQLTVKQVRNFTGQGLAPGRVQGVNDFLVYGTVELRQGANGHVTVGQDSYDFLPHGSFWDNPIRNFETYGGFYVGSHVGFNPGTDFKINFSGLPNVIPLP